MARVLCRWPKLEQIPLVYPHGPSKSFPKLNNSPPPRAKKKYQNCAIPLEFPSAHRGCPGSRPIGKQMVSRVWGNWGILGAIEVLGRVWDYCFCLFEAAESRVNFMAFIIIVHIIYKKWWWSWRERWGGHFVMLIEVVMHQNECNPGDIYKSN